MRKRHLTYTRWRSGEYSLNSDVPRARSTRSNSADKRMCPSSVVRRLYRALAFA